MRPCLARLDRHHRDELRRALVGRKDINVQAIQDATPMTGETSTGGGTSSTAVAIMDAEPTPKRPTRPVPATATPCRGRPARRRRRVGGATVCPVAPQLRLPQLRPQSLGQSCPGGRHRQCRSEPLSQSDLNPNHMTVLLPKTMLKGEANCRDLRTFAAML